MKLTRKVLCVNPCFKSMVIVDNIRYDSLPGFSNCKDAEQSAVEIALIELAKLGSKTEWITIPLEETSLCKNLLQQYAQKMKYALPVYICQNSATPGKMPFTCIVEIGGIQYTGAAARTKRAAEINVARVALLGIQSNPKGSIEKCIDNSRYMVLPCKKKTTLDSIHNKTTASLKPQKAHCKVKSRRNLPIHLINEVTSFLDEQGGRRSTYQGSFYTVLNTSYSFSL
ncbi:hypothetical protein IFM89_022404 [Coptis chinensis]|uniref:DRBM domain-containing protein n=1 Tax=Coptis chinensis TaxID=261450 RepID=A0A835I2G6_9MAGN|nr:hypothetical protein IFM89_022404 [Coptis chinensis]